MLKQKGEFVAYTKAGKPVNLRVFVEIISFGTPDNPNAIVEGAEKKLITVGGQTVIRLEKGRYQIVGTEEILTSEDPLAV